MEPVVGAARMRSRKKASILPVLLWLGFAAPAPAQLLERIYSERNLGASETGMSYDSSGSG